MRLAWQRIQVARNESHRLERCYVLGEHVPWLHCRTCCMDGIQGAVLVIAKTRTASGWWLAKRYEAYSKGDALEHAVTAGALGLVHEQGRPAWVDVRPTQQQPCITRG